MSSAREELLEIVKLTKAEMEAVRVGSLGQACAILSSADQRLTRLAAEIAALREVERAARPLLGAAGIKPEDRYRMRMVTMYVARFDDLVAAFAALDKAREATGG